MIDYRPLILTADMERRTYDRFESLRTRHFPPERNRVPAHLTLFHHLPGGELESIASRVKQICRGTRAPKATVTGLRSLGPGVAFQIVSQDLVDVREELAHAWENWLIPQDRVAFRPHVTIQNKVPPAEAKLLLQALQRDFEPWSFAIEGLALWRYLDGPWEPVRSFHFLR